jgi:hypothetical protein
VSKHWKLLSIALVFVSLVYGGLSTTYYCGYDDFNDIRRAAFEDTRDPGRIFTTTHFGGSKYRPVQRGLTYLTWTWGRHNPAAFRIRNLFFHLAGVAFVYGIAWLLFGSFAAAFSAAILFGLNPMANQSIVAAIWTNTTAYALMFGSFFLFLLSLRENGRSRLWLCSSFALLFVGLFTYEPVIVVIGFMIGYLAIRLFRSQGPSRGYLAAFAAATLPVLLIFFAARQAVVHDRMPFVPVALQAHNLALFGAGLLTPFDFVLSNAVFHTPLPSQVRPSGGVSVIILAIGLAAMIVAVVRLPSVWARRKRVDGLLSLFLAVCIPATLVPFLFFTAHASETYLYAASAIYAILLSSLLVALLPLRAVQVIVGLFALSFTAADLVRNSRVAVCGAAAQTTLSQLPRSSWREGPAHIYLATPPGQESGPRYGMYGYSGLSSIEVEGLGIRSAEAALQIVTGNDRVVADVLPPGTMADKCTAPQTCFLVYRDGTVHPWKASAGSSGQSGTSR